MINDRQVSNWCSVNHLLLADWCHHWLNANCVSSRFVTTSFFLVDPWLSIILRAATVNMFSSVNQMMLTSLGEYFSTTVLNFWVFHRSSLHSAPVHGDFWAQIFSQGSVATRLRCDWILHYLLARNWLLSLSLKEFWKSISIWQS